MNKLILSASSISTFKRCPIAFRNAYVYGIRPVEEKESQRIGTNWHEILEVASLEPGEPCSYCGVNANKWLGQQDCPVCEGTNVVPGDIMDAVIRVLDKTYTGKEFNDPEIKKIERLTLLYSLMGYRWYYGNVIEPTITREQYFSLPLLNPQTGHPVPDVFLEGRIDKLVRLTNGIGVKEHKSTSKSVDPDSTYWGHLNLDTQTSLYIYAARRLEQPVNTVKYDVWHKPQISPKKLTQGDSAEFIKTGEYCGQKFNVTEPGQDTNQIEVYVNGNLTQVEPGKKEGTFAIQETPEMFAARLLQDITERPEFYFRCIELTRTDGELKAFEQELYDIAKNMQFMIRSGRYYTNEHQCEATFRCDYIEQCYNRSLVDPNNIPDGMKCIFNKENKNDSN